jgi:predicted enzyme related to lactoylglutathione lyase
MTTSRSEQLSTGLGNGRVETSIAVSNLAVARDFYERGLGLDGVPEGDGVRYTCGESTRMFVYTSPEHAGATSATVAGFFVEALEPILAALRQRGIEPEHYDQPGLATDENGIFQGPDFRAAWVRDPDGNTLAITEQAAQELPPSPGSGPAPVVHAEILGPDVAGTAAFYAALFGWQGDPDTPVVPEVADEWAYYQVGGGRLPDGSGIPVGLGGGPGRAARTLFYVGVPDVEAALAAAERLGATREMGPSRAPGRPLAVGWFTDPQGRLVGVAGPAGSSQ